MWSNRSILLSLKCPLQNLWILVQHSDANQASASCHLALWFWECVGLPSTGLHAHEKEGWRRAGKGHFSTKLTKRMILSWHASNLEEGKSSAAHSLRHLFWEEWGQVADPAPGKVNVGLKAWAEVRSSRVFTLASELIKNHLTKQNCPTKEITLYPFCVCVCVFFFPAVTTTLSSWSGHARKCNETAKSYCVNGGVCYYIEGINQLSCK